MSRSAILQYKVKRVLDTLSSKEGRGTELITLYVPPNRQIHEAMTNLREEYGTASNIKSRTTRKNVQDAIERVMQKLKLFREPPPNGIAIFCGAIPQNGPGSERMEIYVLEPPEPINVYFYRCDNKFHLAPLQEVLREKEVYGVILIDANDATIATLHGKNLTINGEYRSGVGGKHKTGGQSARRFERIREQEIGKYFTRVGSHADEILLNTQGLKGIIIGGPGPTKYDFTEGDHLNYMLKQKVLATVDTSYTGKNGVEEVIAKSSDILQNVRYSEEKKAVQEFLYEIGHDTGLAVYGEDVVRRYLRERVVDTVLLSEKLLRLHVFVKCGQCDYQRDVIILPSSSIKYEQDLASEKCPRCSNQSLGIEVTKDLVDEFIEMAEQANAKLELISSETDEGVMLLKSFGGIAAVLKYKPGL